MATRHTLCVLVSALTACLHFTILILTLCIVCKQQHGRLFDRLSEGTCIVTRLHVLLSLIVSF